AGVDGALAGPLIAARGTGAFGAEVVVGQAIRRAILPGQLEDLFGLVGADIRGGIAHRKFSAPSAPEKDVPPRRGAKAGMGHPSSYHNGGGAKQGWDVDSTSGD